MKKTDVGNNSYVVCRNRQGVEATSDVLRLNQYQVVFELRDPDCILQTSEVLSELKIVFRERIIYTGQAVVKSLVNTGTAVICEAALAEHWGGVDLLSVADVAPKMREGYESFMAEWQKVYRVSPEFKGIMADMQTFLADFQVWLDQVQLQLDAAPLPDRAQMEHAALQELGGVFVPSFNHMHERLEEISSAVPQELRPVHQSFCKRQLHHLVLCSPFASRTFHKPLGYAGDYEMVNMIVRDPFEGKSLFAKLMNLWFLSQWPSRAHRNRINHLEDRLIRESARVAREGRPVRIFNLGCGPALEIQRFLRNSPLSDNAEFTLYDFNTETTQYVSDALESTRAKFNRQTRIEIHKKSVAHVLKGNGRNRTDPLGRKFDLIYCAGLFDYLTDSVCRDLMTVFYDHLLPDGLLLATNVDDCQPFRHMLEFVLDWHLIYRTGRQAASLIPKEAPNSGEVMKDPSTVNLFIEVRKPKHAE